MLLLLAFALPVALPLTRGLLSTCRLDGLLFDDLDACLDGRLDEGGSSCGTLGRTRPRRCSGTEHFFLQADLRIAFYLNVLSVLPASTGKH